MPKDTVTQSQVVLDEFVEDGDEDDEESDIHLIGPLTLSAFSKDAFESGELLNGTPINNSGDGSGDLAMGRQTLLLLWLLEGEYVERFGGKRLVDILKNFQLGPILHPNPVLPRGADEHPTARGAQEWTRLQEYNFYKSGAPLRLARVCEGGAGTESCGSHHGCRRQQSREQLRRQRAVQGRLRRAATHGREGGNQDGHGQASWPIPPPTRPCWK